MVYYLCKTACLNKMSKLNVDPNKFGPDRYQMPAAECRSQKNNKTYFTNIEDISKDLNRTSEELLKFLGYHLNTQTNTSQNSFNGVYTTEKMQESVYDYIRSYVLCPTCNNPETKVFVSKSKKLKVGCIACGANQEVSNNAKFDKWMLIKFGDDDKKSKKKKRGG